MAVINSKDFGKLLKAMENPPKISVAEFERAMDAVETIHVDTKAFECQCCNCRRY